MTRFSGVYVAIITPFTENYDVDYDGLAQHTSWLIDAGVNGIVATGSCGEYAVLAEEERERVIRTLAEITRGRVPLVVGTAAPGSHAVHKWAALAREVGAQGLMALPPVLYKPMWNEVEAHYGMLNDVGLPIIVYNNPHDTAVDITPERLGQLARTFENLVAVKEFSGDVRRISEIREHSDIEIVAGTDDLLVESILAGATGWIGGMANIVPVESVRLLKLAVEGKTEDAWALYRTLLPLLRYDSTPRLVQVIKYGMEQIGRSAGPARPPRLVLDEADAKVVRGVLAQM